MKILDFCLRMISSAEEKAEKKESEKRLESYISELKKMVPVGGFTVSWAGNKLLSMELNPTMKGSSFDQKKVNELILAIQIEVYNLFGESASYEYARSWNTLKFNI